MDPEKREQAMLEDTFGTNGFNIHTIENEEGLLMDSLDIMLEEEAFDFGDNDDSYDGNTE